MSARRVLHLGKFYPPFAGGVESFHADLMNALHRRGLPVAALVHEHEPWGHREVATSWPYPVYRARTYGRLLYTPLAPGYRRTLTRAIADFGPELLHLHMPNPSVFWALSLAAARRLPWLVHWHADVVASRHDRGLALAYRFYRPWEQRVLARSAAVIVTSPPYLQSSEALRPWRSKCHVVPLGIDPARLPEPTTAELARAQVLWRSPGALRVLAVGRLSYYKGFDVLIRAAALVPEVQVLVVGGGERFGRLQRLVAQLGLGQRVSLLGRRPEVERNALLATSDVFCLPSIERTEAFGVALLEAMRYGRAIVVSAIAGSGTGWVVRPEREGVGVTPGNSVQLAAALRGLQEAPELRERYGAAGARRFAEKFTMPAVAAEIARVYESLASSPRQCDRVLS